MRRNRDKKSIGKHKSMDQASDWFAARLVMLASNILRDWQWARTERDVQVSF